MKLLYLTVSPISQDVRNRPLLLLLRLALTTMILLSCSTNARIEVDGTLLVWYAKQITYDLSSRQFKLSHPEWESRLRTQIHCFGPNNTLIVSLTDSGIERFMFQGTLVGPSIICTYSIEEDVYSLISDPEDSLLIVNSLDYDTTTREYVFCGIIDAPHAPGVYRLDSTFRVIEDLFPKIRSNVKDAKLVSPEAYRIGRNEYLINMLVRDEIEIYIYNDSTVQSTFVTKGKIKSLTRDKTLAVVSKGSKKQQNHYLLQLSGDYSMTLFLENVNAMDFSFSPDNEHVAFLVQTYDLRDRVELWLQDLTSLKRENTGEYARGSLIWLEK